MPASLQTFRFRLKILAALMLVVVLFAGLALYVAEQKNYREVILDQHRVFLAEFDAWQKVRTARHAHLTLPCQKLVHRPRIQASFEDDALDLLYPSARDEMNQIMRGMVLDPEDHPYSMKPVFYRFLDHDGKIISPEEITIEGNLNPQLESQLEVPEISEEPELGYVFVSSDSGSVEAVEVMATPIISLATGEIMAALVVGFNSFLTPSDTTSKDVSRFIGIFGENRLYLEQLEKDSDKNLIHGALEQMISSGESVEGNMTVPLEQGNVRLFFKILNPNSSYPPAHEVCLFPLTVFEQRLGQVRRQIISIGLGLIFIGFVTSHFMAGRLSRPVEQLEADSESNRVGRELAEDALEQSHVELQRSRRFSANASHQLKTPVAVLRAGLEDMLSRKNLPAGMAIDLEQSIMQTFRLGRVIEDLLLLSQMDAGRFHLNCSRLDLTEILEGELDDFEVQANPLNIEIKADLPAKATIQGEKRYVTMILRNLLENAAKYNRENGQMTLSLSIEDPRMVIKVGNTGNAIPEQSQSHIFERFHRGNANENVSGHGLGLNIARDLTRLHGGDMLLESSKDDWTQFVIWFPSDAGSVVDG